MQDTFLSKTGQPSSKVHQYHSTESLPNVQEIVLFGISNCDNNDNKASIKATFFVVVFYVWQKRITGSLSKSNMLFLLINIYPSIEQTQEFFITCPMVFGLLKAPTTLHRNCKRHIWLSTYQTWQTREHCIQMNPYVEQKTVSTRTLHVKT